jgi:hypothetical protein
MGNRLKHLPSSRWWYPAIYSLIIVTAASGYWFVRSVMIDQQTWFVVLKSNITLNFVLLFFLYGVLCDKITKRVSKKKAWMVWGAGLLILLLFFRFVGGYETVFG